MKRLAAALFLLTLGGAAACDEGRSPRCREVCDREARCAEEREEREESETFRFDREECVATCTSLERDKKGKKLVEEHAACVAEAESCEEVFDCR